MEHGQEEDDKIKHTHLRNQWTKMDKFNSVDITIYYGGQESVTRNGVVLTVNKRLQNVVLGYSLKNDRMISDSIQGKPFCVTVI